MDEQRRLWMEATLTVLETLLHVGTSERALASIDDARKLLGENIWGSEDDDAKPAPADSFFQLSEHGFGALLATTCGLEHTICNPMFTAVDAGQSYRSAFPFHPASGGDGIFGSERFISQSDEIDIARGGVLYFNSEGFRSGSHDNITRGGERYIGPEGFSSEGDGPAYDERFHSTLMGDAAYDYMANRIAGALAPNGTLTAAHREITHLVALHGEAGHVLALCAAPLGLLLLRRDGDDDSDRAAFLPNAHAALRSLSSAASATAAAEDFLRSRAARSQARCGGSWSVVTQLVGDAKRDVLEARRAVERMQDAAVRNFFHAWMVIKRAPSS